ncbi:MAG: hypothetical protein GWP14_07150 [Actinobacteria bacterium]|nr:hypothetical protein [Actinomycetota bacterium]
MKKKLCLLSLLGVLVSVGCLGRVIKESYYGATGATGRVNVLQNVKVDLSRYDSFSVEQFSDAMEGQGNMAFLAVVEKKVAEIVAKKTYLNATGTKSLKISGSLISYDTGTTTEKIAGPMEQAICRIKLIDADSGKVLGVADCLSRAKSSVRKGPEELGEGTGKGIAEWIIKNDSRGARPEEEN